MNTRQGPTAQHAVWVHGDDGRFANFDGVAGKPFMPGALRYKPP